MFKSIKIKNLRAITDLKIDNFGQVNLLVGNNNCGKTTVLEALFFLSAGTNPNTPITANSLRGLPVVGNELWHTFFHNMNEKQPIHIFGYQYDKPNSFDLTVRIKEKHDLEMDQLTSGIGSLKNNNHTSATTNLARGLDFEFIDRNNNNNEPNIASVYQKEKKLVTDGYIEPSFNAYYITPATASEWKEKFASVQRKKQISEVIECLKCIEPLISDLRLNEIGLLEADISLPSLIPVNLLGDGIKRFLAIALGILDHKNGIVLVDEIENGLHHSSQEVLWENIIRWSEKLNVQVFATTHSYECIKAFANSTKKSLFQNQAKLFRIERGDDSFHAIEYTQNVLHEALDSHWEVR